MSGTKADAESETTSEVPAPSGDGSIAVASSTDPLIGSLASLRERLNAATTLTDDQVTSANETLNAAAAAVEARQQAETDRDRLLERLRTAPEQAVELERELAEPIEPKPIPDTLDIPWESAVAGAEADAAAIDVARTQLADRIALEMKRRKAIPTELEAARRRLTELERRLDSPATNLPEILRQADLANLQAQRGKVIAEIELLQQQARTYEGTSRKLVLELDALTRRFSRAESYVQRLREKMLAVRESAAARQVREVQAKLDAAAPSYVEGLRQNLQLAVENVRLVDELEDIEEKLAAAEQARDNLTTRFGLLRKRAEAANFSSSAGSLLRNYRHQLAPAQATLNGLARVRSQNGEAISVEEASAATQTQLARYEAAKEAMLNETTDDPTEREILGERRSLLLELIDNASKLLFKLVALETVRESLAETIAVQSEFVAGNVLWVRSAPAIGLQTFREAGATLPALLDRSAWGEAGALLMQDVRANPVWIVLVAILLAASFFVRARLRKILKDCCDAARKPTLISAMPTIKAFTVSVLLALFIPGVAWLIGNRLEHTATTPSVPAAVGHAMQRMALLGFFLEFVRIVSRPHGLGASHFNWPKDAVSSVRTVLWTLIVVALPAGLLGLALRRLGDEDAINSLGRLAFLVSVAAFGWAGWRLFRRRGPVMEAARARSTESILAQARYVWATAAIGIPIVLAVMAAEGHFYTAQQFAHRALLTAIGLSLVLFLQAMFNRILLVTYRGLAIKRAQEKRAERAAQAEARGEEKSEPSDVIEAETDEPEVPLIEVSQQNRKLIRIGTVIAVLVVIYAAWSAVLPAVNWIGDIGLYDDEIAREAGFDDGATIDDRMVTLNDLLQATMLAALTIFAARNVPGLLEIVVLQRLPLDAGARYAAAAIARYAIAIVGVIVSFRLIGIGWGSVQWLVAGVSVGLGFGLQEIFANFVSGLILLFERPIRVGDTVTINDITGTVTRIRIRATTVLDWDNRELVMPNKDFVTGNLINWTLSNPNVRVVQSIGIAYGSDTELATRLLKEVAEANPRILSEPPPLVVFLEFGDNSLLFEVRFFVTGLQAFRTIRHELNMAIDKAFRQAEIEISFPQRDLHLRSIDSSVADAIAQKPESFAYRD